jgi:hypothetical protein
MRASKERARRAVQSLGDRGVTTRVPASVREAVVAYAREARSAGAPWSEIVAQVRLSKTSVQRWMEDPSAAGSPPQAGPGHDADTGDARDRARDSVG